MEPHFHLVSQYRHALYRAFYAPLTSARPTVSNRSKLQRHPPHSDYPLRLHLYDGGGGRGALLSRLLPARLPRHEWTKEQSRALLHPARYCCRRRLQRAQVSRDKGFGEVSLRTRKLTIYERVRVHF
jgi:hypothetical protein